LPTPQISDQELEDIIKVGQASQLARQQAEESGVQGGATNALLSDYNVTTSERIANLRTPRTPAVQDNILMVCEHLLYSCFIVPMLYFLVIDLLLVRKAFNSYNSYVFQNHSKNMDQVCSSICTVHLLSEGPEVIG
jgi:hypothetical protein